MATPSRAPLERVVKPPTTAALPAFDRGWLVAPDSREAFLRYSSDASVNWSDELEQLHDDQGRLHFIDVATRRAMLAVLDQADAGATIVDLGCSSGYLLEELRAAHPDATLLGIDLVASGLRRYNRIVLVDLLAKLGITALAAGDGAEALALAGRKDFDFIFLDYDLPGLSGLEVSRGIRTLATGSARAHILATTAFSTPEKQAQCLAAGMNAFLGKPVTTERLRKALAAAAGETVTPALATVAVDGLANLRLLATKKKIRFEDELSLYLSELQMELDELGAAVHDEDTPEAAHYAHLLCGRCSFIYERTLEQLLRQIEETVAKGRWPEARQQWTQLLAQTAELRLRLVSSVPTVPPA